MVSSHPRRKEEDKNESMKTRDEHVEEGVGVEGRPDAQGAGGRCGVGSFC